MIGRYIIFDGLCISVKSKNQFFLASSISLKKINEDEFFLSFPIYLSGALNFNIIGVTYGFKVNSSKLVEARFKKS
jgi:hypothetical protein